MREDAEKRFVALRARLATGLMAGAILGAGVVVMPLAFADDPVQAPSTKETTGDKAGVDNKTYGAQQQGGLAHAQSKDEVTKDGKTYKSKDHTSTGKGAAKSCNGEKACKGDKHKGGYGKSPTADAPATTSGQTDADKSDADKKKIPTTKENPNPEPAKPQSVKTETPQGVPTEK